MVQVYAPTAIDLSRAIAPEAIEALDFETLYSGFKTRFLTYWDALREDDASLPEYTTQSLESEPAGIIGEAWSYLRLLDRQRVNDAVKALLAPLSTGSNLDALVAARNIERLTIVEETENAPAILEGDASLLRRYLLSFDRPAAGSASRYLYDAWAAWPQSEDKNLGLWDARVNGWAIHGCRGDTDVVIIGPNGRAPTEPELAMVRAAVTHVDRKPEAVDVRVLAATRVTYTVSLVIEVPGIGPAPETLRAEAEARVRAAATNRILVGGEVPAGLLAGAAYGNGILKVRDLSPVVIAPDAYSVPVMTSLTITTEVRT